MALTGDVIEIYEETLGRFTWRGYNVEEESGFADAEGQGWSNRNDCLEAAIRANPEVTEFVINTDPAPEPDPEEEPEP